jgi:hypothetical protein
MGAGIIIDIFIVLNFHNLFKSVIVIKKSSAIEVYVF